MVSDKMYLILPAGSNMRAAKTPNGKAHLPLQAPVMGALYRGSMWCYKEQDLDKYGQVEWVGPVCRYMGNHVWHDEAVELGISGPSDEDTSEMMCDDVDFITPVVEWA